MESVKSQAPKKLQVYDLAYRRIIDRQLTDKAKGFITRQAKAGKPFFMRVNFMKVHQPNLPHPDFIHKSLSKSKFADSIVEADTRIGNLMEKLRSLGLDKNTLDYR